MKFAQYTGQEKDEQRKAIIANPPDILITNYVMAELILTRPDERQLVEAARGLRFLVMDELHTYRGRQGADVALLIRRLRDRVGGESLQYVGTSATMASGGNFDQQQREVAGIATKFFGATVLPEDVIGETLKPATKPIPLADPAFLAGLRERVESDAPVPSRYEEFVSDPLSSWIEHRLGLTTEDGTGRLIRGMPRSLTGVNGAAEKLAEETGLCRKRCAEVLERQLLGSYSTGKNPENGFPPFAFRLHQFISKGDTVYATLESEAAERFVSW